MCEMRALRTTVVLYQSKGGAGEIDIRIVINKAITLRGNAPAPAAPRQGQTHWAKKGVAARAFL